MLPCDCHIRILQQIVQYLPCWTFEKLANKHRIDARSFSATSHVVALMVAHLAHTSSLNETCDVCSMHEKKPRYVRNVTPPHRNTLSSANRTRPAAMAEELFWTVKAALETDNVTVNGRTFNQRGRPTGFLHRFKKAIYAIDSTTIQLVLNCIDWDKPRLCLEQACFKGFEDPTEKPMGQKRRRKPRKRGVGNGRR